MKPLKNLTHLKPIITLFLKEYRWHAVFEAIVTLLAKIIEKW